MSIIYPKEIFNRLNLVVGQDNCKKVISTEFSLFHNNRLVGQKNKAPRILMGGSTGSGKTFLLKELERSLTNFDSLRPYRLFFIDASCLSGSTWHGTSLGDKIKDFIKDFKNNFRNNYKYLQTLTGLDENAVAAIIASGYIFVFDEFDKCSSNFSQGDHKEHFQNELLYFLENGEEFVQYDDNENKFQLTIDFSSIPMIFLGSFQKILENKKNHRSIGFSTIETEEKELVLQEFVKNGYIKELIGRMTSFIQTTPLNKKDLIKICKDQNIDLIRKPLQIYNVTVDVEDSFWEEVVDKSLELGEGARGMVKVVKEFINNLIFDVDTLDPHVVLSSLKNEVKVGG